MTTPSRPQSPLPWIVEKSFASNVIHTCKIGYLSAGGPGITYPHRVVGRTTEDEDAEFICLAVNNFAPMLELLTEISTALIHDPTMLNLRERNERPPNRTAYGRAG